MIGIAARSYERARWIADQLQLEHRAWVPILDTHSSRGIQLNAIIWVDALSQEVLNAVQPALLGAIQLDVR